MDIGTYIERFITCLLLIAVAMLIACSEPATMADGTPSPRIEVSRSNTTVIIEGVPCHSIVVKGRDCLVCDQGSGEYRVFSLTCSDRYWK